MATEGGKGAQQGNKDLSGEAQQTAAETSGGNCGQKHKKDSSGEAQQTAAESSHNREEEGKYSSADSDDTGAGGMLKEREEAVKAVK